MEAIKDEYYDIIIPAAKEAVKEDRAKYADVYELLYEECKKRKLILSDIGVLLGEKQAYAGEVNVFTDTPYSDAKYITDKIAEKIGKWVTMSTVVYGKKLLIKYDSRPICRFHRINRPNSVDLYSLVLPETIHGLSYIPPELEIIEVYHKLYSIDSHGDWGDLVKLEDMLWKLVLSRQDVIGGSEQPKYDNLKVLKKLIIEGFITDEVILNEYNFENPSDTKSNIDKLQVISNEDPVNYINRLGGFISKYSSLKMEYRKHDLKIPYDTRTARYTVYLWYPSGRKPVKKSFMDVFNSAAFELVPYNEVKIGTKKYRVANDYVKLRFLAIDMWILRMVMKMNANRPNDHGPSHHSAHHSSSRRKLHVQKRRKDGHGHARWHGGQSGGLVIRKRKRDSESKTSGSTFFAVKIKNIIKRICAIRQKIKGVFGINLIGKYQSQINADKLEASKSKQIFPYYAK
jgi:hypothetical protein